MILNPVVCRLKQKLRGKMYLGRKKAVLKYSITNEHSWENPKTKRQETIQWYQSGGMGAAGRGGEEVMFIKYQDFEESKVKNVCATTHKEILSVFCSFWEYGVL